MTQDPEREALQFIAEGITELAGFGAAAISIVRGDFFVTLAVAADEAAAGELMQLRTPVAAVLGELEGAETWGMFTFLPGEQATSALADYNWVPQLEKVQEPGAWDPMDLLCALLHDDRGRLCGLLSIDLPRNGRRPDAAQRRTLDLYARQAARAVLTVIERERFRLELVEERTLAAYRRQLVDTVSHQLQTPAMVVATNVEHAHRLMQDGASTVELDAALAAAGRGAARISATISDLLAMARVDDPDRRPPTTTVELVAIVRGAVDLVRAARPGAQIAEELPPEAWIVGDEAEMRDLVVNLVDNAVKYSEGEVCVALEVGAAEVRLQVADDGIGIAAEDLPNVFEPFFRAPDAQARRRPGTGLGLAIVDRIVRRHRGDLKVESDLGVGTRITTSLPVRVGRDENGTPAPSTR